VDDHERFYRAKIEFGIVSICYYSNLAMFEERTSALEFLKSNFEKTDNLHHKIYARMIISNNESDRMKRLKSLSAGLAEARTEGVTWLEANYELLLAISLRDSVSLMEWNSAEPEHLDMIVPDSVALNDVPVYLAESAIDKFSSYGDYYMKTEAIAVKASCYTQRGEYEKALGILADEGMFEVRDYYLSFYPDMAAEYTWSIDDIRFDSLLASGGAASMHNIPECILSLRREASCAYAGTGDIDNAYMNWDAHFPALGNQGT
jgi:hypothetical protein